MRLGHPRGRSMRIAQFALIGAVGLGALFLLSWASDASAAQSLLSFFTQEAIRTPDDMGSGLAIMMVIGGVLGAIASGIIIVLGVLSQRGGPSR